MTHRAFASLALVVLAVASCQLGTTSTELVVPPSLAPPNQFKLVGAPALLAAAASPPLALPPLTPPTSTPLANNLPTITIDPANVLGRSNSHLLGTCRNHVAGKFPNGAAKLQALKQLQPTWGDRKYLYRVGHGITDGRTDYSYMTGLHFEQLWNSSTSYPYDDVRNALTEADTVGADQLQVVNFGTSDPSEAARYVSFLNHAGDANRAQHPIAQQNVQLFEIGNEIAWDHERGHAQYASNEKVYATRALQFARAMRAASDVPIQIGAVASINSNFLGNGWSGGASTVKNILGIMGKDVDFLVFHGYPSYPLLKAGDLTTVMAQNEWNRQELEQVIFPAIRATRPGVGVANTEFFDNLYNDTTHAQGLFGAMYDADSVILAMNEGLLTSVEFCFSHDNLADSAFFYNDDPNKTTPIYQFQQLLAAQWGDQVVKSTATGIPTRTVKGAATQLSMPLLSYTAAKSGAKVYVMVLNRTNDTDVACRLDVGAPSATYTAYTLSGSKGWDSTTAAVNSRPGAWTGTYTFPRATVTILAFDTTAATPAPLPSASATPTPLPSPSGTPLPSPTPSPSGTPLPAPSAGPFRPGL